MIRRIAALAGWLLAATLPAAAQQPPPATDADDAIRVTLRAFYFNLAHEDWEALAADILSAKVLASRPPPEALLAPAVPPRSNDAYDCEPEAPARVDRAAITVDGGWARVVVPRCAARIGAADEFRLVRFETRWRIVYIDLFRPDPAVELAR